jgi:hypothetical protein
MTTPQKIKVAILFVGQIRTNSLSLINEHTNPKDIINSYNTYLFTNEWKDKIDYDIFISTDDMHLKNTFEYFGNENIKNIHLMEPNYLLNPITKIIPDEKYFMDIYNTNDFQGLYYYPGNIYQFYKWYDALNLLNNYTNYNSGKYDYIIKSRLDIEFLSNIMECVDLLQENSDIQLIGQDDWFAIGRPNIMQNAYMNLITKPLYDFRKTNHSFEHNLIEYKKYMEDKINTSDQGFFKWTYAPETQLYESLFEYCSENNMDIDTSIKYKNICVITHRKCK